MTTAQIKKMIEHPHLLGHYFVMDDLTEIHSEWIKYCWQKGSTKVLQAHRNSYKTSSIIVIGTILYLLFHPNATILVTRKTEEGAKAIVYEVCKLLESEKARALFQEVYKAVTGKKIAFELKDYTTQKINLPTRTNYTKEYNVESIGIGGNITGAHYDIIICDDIITEKDRYSQAERKRTKNYLMELQNIMKVDGHMFVTGTPWHKDDAFSILPEAKKYPLGSIEIKGLTQEKINKIKAAMSDSLFAANYLLQHIASENRVFGDAKRAQWNNAQCVAALDPAYMGTNTTALTLIGKNDDGQIVVKGWVWRKDVTELYIRIVSLLDQHGAGTLWVEENADKGLCAKELRKQWHSVKTYVSTKNKLSRILTHVKANWDYLHFADDIQDDYYVQVLDYEEMQEPDDAVDSLAAAIEYSRIFDTSNGVVEFEEYAEEFVI